MTTDRALLIMALIFIVLLITRNSNYNQTITDMQQEEKKLVSQVQYLEFSNEKIQEESEKEIDNLNDSIFELNHDHVEVLRAIDKK